MAYVGGPHAPGGNCKEYYAPQHTCKRGRPKCPVCWNSLLSISNDKKLKAADVARKEIVDTAKTIARAAKRKARKSQKKA